MTKKAQTNVEKEITEEEKRSMKISFRVFQAIFLGIFALGLSLILGDLTEAYTIPISKFSLATTVFGGLGAMITGILANKCQEW